VELVEKSKKYLDLKSECPGSKYSDLFLTTGNEGDPRKGYEESSGSD